MNRKIITFIALISLLSSCVNYKMIGYENRAEYEFTIPDNFWFTSSKPKETYKINISAFHQKQSGMLIVKQVQSSSLRMLMLTEFGLKVFDVEYFTGDSLKVHYMMKHLDNPYIVNTIFDNLKVLWPGVISDSKSRTYYNEKTSAHLFQIKHSDELWNYHSNNMIDVNRIERIQDGKKKSEIIFEKETNTMILKTKRPAITIRLKKIDDVER